MMLSDVWRLSDFCLSVYLSRTSGLSREQRGLRRPKLAQGSPCHTWLGHHFQRQRLRSPGRFTHRRVGASGSCSGGRGNVMAVRNWCYVVVCSAARGPSAPTGEEMGGGISWRPPTYSLFYLQLFTLNIMCSNRACFFACHPVFLWFIFCCLWCMKLIVIYSITMYLCCERPLCPRPSTAMFSK